MLSRAEGAELLGGGIDLDLASKPRSAFPAFSETSQQINIASLPYSQRVQYIACGICYQGCKVKSLRASDAESCGCLT